MNAPENRYLADVQSLPDSRSVAIEQVGIRGLRYPLSLLTQQGVQHTVADLEMTVLLDPQVKGTHMSRFVEIVETWNEPISVAGFADATRAMLGRLEARAGRIEMRFPYFIRKAAPVSGVESLLDYQAGLSVEIGETQEARLTLSLTAPVTSLCPCSKEISQYGAHNQRSHVGMRVTLSQPDSLDLHALARIAEDVASCEVYGLLKRPDEKFVTERAYENPKFVEDLIRDLALALKSHPCVASYEIEVENFESIHNHSAYARLSGQGAAGR